MFQYVKQKKVLDFSYKIFEGKFKSSKKVVLEEFLDGEEASYFIIADKNNFKFFGTAQDHKRVYENDKGPNTGDGSIFSCSNNYKSIEKKIIQKIIYPTLKFLKTQKKHYSGILYAGLMIKNNEPYLIEYNIRMGDPECQVILPRLETDIVKIFTAVIKNKLKKINLKWKKEKSMTIVLCSKGYPRKYKKDLEIKNLDKIALPKNNFIYHAGTKRENNKILSSGGRVLNITSVGMNFRKIREQIFLILKKINWKNGFFRQDIGWKVINYNENYKRKI